MYEKDPQRKLKENVEEIFGLYVLNPSRRHSEEKVELKPGKSGTMGVELSMFFDQRESQDKDLVRCYAFRWLLLGRFGEGGGARGLFSRYPKTSHADLRFYTLVSSRSVKSDGTYVVKLERKDFLTARITRARAKQLNWDAVEKALSVDGAKCAQAGEKAVDRHWYGNYLGKR